MLLVLVAKIEQLASELSVDYRGYPPNICWSYILSPKLDAKEGSRAKEGATSIFTNFRAQCRYYFDVWIAWVNYPRAPV